MCYFCVNPILATQIVCKQQAYSFLLGRKRIHLLFLCEPDFHYTDILVADKSSRKCIRFY